MTTKSGKTVFVDCNDTLIAVRFASRNDAVPEGFRSIERGGQHYHVQARPSALEFVTALSAEGHEVVVLTGGSTGIQYLLLSLGGLGREVDDVVGFENSGKVELPQNWVLVDDLQGGSSSFVEKLDMLGISKRTLGDKKYGALVEQRCVQCVSFKGGDDSHPLTALLDDIKAKLAA
jgi:hypothetical protein